MRKLTVTAAALILAACGAQADRSQSVDTTLPNGTSMVGSFTLADMAADNIDAVAENLEAMADSMDDNMTAVDSNMESPPALDYNNPSRPYVEDASGLDTMSDSLDTPISNEVDE